MAKTTVTVTYAHPGAQPPVYLAGSFTDWQPLEMDTEEVNGEYHFHKKVSVEEGHQFQYKFRLGPGDWWVLNESSPIATDSAGNRNNLLDVPTSAPPAPSELEDSDSNATSKIYTPNTQSSSPDETESLPIIIVEKMDGEPRYGEDFGADASYSQKQAHEMREKDAEPDYVVVTSKLEAETAAEVANSAAVLDRDIQDSADKGSGETNEKSEAPTSSEWGETPKPTSSGDNGNVDGGVLPIVKDSHQAESNKSEADTKSTSTLSGVDARASNRRASEVEIEAQIVLNDGVNKAFETNGARQYSGPVPARAFRFDLEPASGTCTPFAERAPLLPHERLEEYTKHTETQEAPDFETEETKLGPDTEEAIPDPPELEHFPTEQTAILAHIRTTSSRLDEDEVDAFPPAQEPEQCECSSKNVSETGSPVTEAKSSEPKREDPEEEQQPELLSEPRKPDSSNPSEQQVERSISRSSISIKPAEKQSFFRHIWRTVFVGFIGGFFIRLCGGKRQAVLAAVAITLSIAAPAVLFKPADRAR